MSGPGSGYSTEDGMRFIRERDALRTQVTTLVEALEKTQDACGSMIHAGSPGASRTVFREAYLAAEEALASVQETKS